MTLECVDQTLLAEVRVANGPLHVLIDSTGLKVYGAGKWLVQKHGQKSRRGWRKLHLAVDADSGQIVASMLMEQEVACSAISRTRWSSAAIVIDNLIALNPRNPALDAIAPCGNSHRSSKARANAFSRRHTTHAACTHSTPHCRARRRRERHSPR